MKLEVAIKHLEEMLKDTNREWNCKECRQEHKELLDFLKELRKYRENGKWISTKDRMPEDHTKVLIVVRDKNNDIHITVGDHNKIYDNWVVLYGDDLFVGNEHIPYWQPLPDLPEELRCKSE